MKNRCRSIWLRQGGSSNPVASGKQHCIMLSAIGNAAARETLVTETSHMAAIWTDLFDDLIVPIVPNSPRLCWRGDGPGIGRDARTAYSGLLGRYMARAYLTEHEDVLVLVPLDEAKRRLKGTGYVIKKKNPRVYEADWLGLDNSGLVIVEAKGTYDEGIKTWCGPCSEPKPLQTAVNQAKNTAVFHFCRELPAKRWAIASRWGTEENCRDTTLLAWDFKEKQLDKNDYEALRDILHLVDVGGILEGMGHSIHTQAQNVEKLIADVPFGRLIIDDRLLESGFAAVVGPFGVRPLLPDDARLLLQVRDPNFSYAVASLSHSYVLEGHIEKGLTVSVQRDFESQFTFTDAPERFAIRRGLTVVWLRPGENVVFEKE